MFMKYLIKRKIPIMFYIVRTKIKKNLKNLFEKIMDFFLCTTWLLNILNGNENSDGYLAYKSVLNYLTCRCVRLCTDSSLYLAGIKGKFQSILLGILIDLNQTIFYMVIKIGSLKQWVK